MAPSFFESLIFGFVSGLSEFLPVSAQAHRIILQRLFGFPTISLLNLLIHAGALWAVVNANKDLIERIRRERRQASLPKRRRKRQPDILVLLDERVVRYAFITSLLGIVLLRFADSVSKNLLAMSVLLAINGMILLIPRLLPSGNKDSRTMSRFDSLLIGLGAAAAMLPGISRIGTTTGTALSRGADKQHALNWAFLLSIPILVFLMGLDVYGIISNGIGDFGVIIALQYVLAAGLSYCGAYLGIIFMRFLAVNLGFSGFAYYCWGAALFSFILYMTI